MANPTFQLEPTRHFLRSRCVWMAMGLLFSASAAACTGQHNAGADISLNITGWANAPKHTRMGNWTNMGANQFLTGCTPGEVVPRDLTALLPELVYVENITFEGLSYPAFGIRGYPRSPLLIFRYVDWDGDPITPDHYGPLDVRVPMHVASQAHATNQRGSIVRMAAMARGGLMESIPSTVLGPVTHISPLYPAFVKTDTFSFSATLDMPTCTFTDKAVSLQDIRAADLPAAGSDAGLEAFEVAMDCNGNFALDLTLTDAHAPGNAGSLLSPASNATADGVRVQLLREGSPVELGKAWPIARTQVGPQMIPLAARYHRIAGDFGAGVVEGQAILTATYR